MSSPCKGQPAILLWFANGTTSYTALQMDRFRFSSLAGPNDCAIACRDVASANAQVLFPDDSCPKMPVGSVLSYAL